MESEHHSTEENLSRCQRRSLKNTAMCTFLLLGWYLDSKRPIKLAPHDRLQ
jgi:hypothetical protein